MLHRLLKVVVVVIIYVKVVPVMLEVLSDILNTGACSMYTVSPKKAMFILLVCSWSYNDKHKSAIKIKAF